MHNNYRWLLYEEKRKGVRRFLAICPSLRKSHLFWASNLTLALAEIDTKFPGGIIEVHGDIDSSDIPETVQKWFKGRAAQAFVVVSCPKCKSTRCFPTFCTAYSYGCIPCGHEFDSRGGFWRKFKAFLTWLFEKPGPPILSEEEHLERDWWDAIK